MWNSSQYGAGSDQEGGGGGFMNSPGVGRGGGGRGGGGGGGTGRINSMSPCTCAELHAATMTDDQFVSPAPIGGGGAPLGQVTLVGRVRQATRSAARIDYLIDDYTGDAIDVKQFVDNEADEAGGFGPTHSDAHPEGAYVRVYGQLRNVQGSRTISAFKVARVTDLNEVSFHMLHVVRSKLASVGSTAAGASQSLTAALGAKPGAGGLTSLTEPGSAGMSKIEQQVIAILRDNDCDEGVSVEQISQRMAGLPVKRVREVLNSLGDEGHVYSSKDDDHYRIVK